MIITQITFLDEINHKDFKKEIYVHILFSCKFTYPLGHLTISSFHKVFVISHPKPGKKSVLCRRSYAVSLILFGLPLSFHAEMHHKVGSSYRSGSVAEKYSKKSGAMSKSSENKKTKHFQNSYIKIAKYLTICKISFSTFYYQDIVKAQSIERVVECPSIMTSYIVVSFQLLFFRRNFNIT